MKNSIIRLNCSDFSVDGQGICKKDGFVYFVKEMLPGEEAMVKIIAEKKNMAFGIVDELIVKSPHRIKSICPIAYKCGGCDLQHIDYDHQLFLKKKVLESTFRNLPLKVNDILACEEPLYYRTKVQVPVRDHQFGFYRKFSNDIVEFEKCYIETLLTNDIFKKAKALLLDLKIDKYLRHVLIKHARGSGEVMLALIAKSLEIPRINEFVSQITSEFKSIKSIIVNLNTRNDNVILGTEEKVVYGNDHIIDEFAGLKLKLSLKSFYQVNYHQMLKLYQTAFELAKPNKDTKVLDLFSGIGTIGLFFVDKVKQVTGVEIIKEAVDNAQENVALNNITNAKFYLDDARSDLSKYLKDQDLVIVDPPRKGLSADLIDSFKKNKVNKIIYISCNPATMARDIALLQDEYSFSDVYPVDMFPQTMHVECVVSMQRKQNNKTS